MAKYRSTSLECFSRIINEPVSLKRTNHRYNEKTSTNEVTDNEDILIHRIKKNFNINPRWSQNE